MNNDVFYSPLSVKRPQQVYHMPVADAQTQYPSLREQCRGRSVCHFTIADIQNANNKRRGGQK